MECKAQSYIHVSAAGHLPRYVDIGELSCINVELDKNKNKLCLYFYISGATVAAS